MSVEGDSQQEQYDPILRKQHNFSVQWLRVEGRLGNVKYYFNPLVTASTFFIVCAVFIWAFVDNESKDRLTAAKKWISDVWTWLYVAEQFLWMVFVIFIYFRWGHIKLGRDEDTPEHDDLSYFVMIFCTGLSAAKYYSGVVDPVLHYTYVGRNSSIIYWGKSGSNEQIQNAINITLHHWGIFGFSVYTLPAITISFLAYRKGLPVTMRTCLYPIIGHKIYGRVGDIIDITSVSATIFGVSVGLAYGANLLVTGIQEWFPNVEANSQNRIITIWILVCIATISVVSGIGFGIKHISLISFLFSVVVLLVTLMADNTWYLLNVFIQSIGYQIQHVIGTGLHTSAFTQLGIINKQNPETKNWFNENTLFYYGWWIAVAPLSATFTARISRGRRISELITYAFFLPSLFLMLWLTTFGGVSIKIQQNAIAAGITCNGGMYLHQKRNSAMEEQWNRLDETYGRIDNLACLSNAAKPFAVMKHYNEIFNILYTINMLGIILQFITHADSSSLVVDMIASNGQKDPPIGQRGLWALVQGAAATAFVQYAEDRDGFETIRAVAVIASLPLVIIVNTSCIGLWRVLSKEKEFKLDTEFKEWMMYYGNINSKRHLKNVLIAIFCPWWFLGKIVIKDRGHTRKLLKLVSYLSFAVPFFLWIALLIAQVAVKDIDKFGWTCLLLFFAHASYYRQRLRQKRKLAGNMVEDFIVVMLYPFAVLQMFHESESAVSADTNHMELPTFISETHHQFDEPNSSPYFESSTTFAEDPFEHRLSEMSVQIGDASFPVHAHSNGESNYAYVTSEIGSVTQLDV